MSYTLLGTKLGVDKEGRFHSVSYTPLGTKLGVDKEGCFTV